MIRVTVEIMGRYSSKKIGTMVIWNESQLAEISNYGVKAHWEGFGSTEGQTLEAEGKVEDHNRNTESIWTLVKKAISGMGL